MACVSPPQRCPLRRDLASAFFRSPYVPLPQQGNLSDREKVLEAGRLMQAELVRLGLSEEDLSADFKAWRKGRPEQPTA